MKRISLAMLFSVAALTTASGQPPTTTLKDEQVLPLWPNGAPGALGQGKPATFRLSPPGCLRSIPRHDGRDRLSGGGYMDLASNHEGRQVANYLNSLGMDGLCPDLSARPATTTRSNSATRSAPSAPFAPKRLSGGSLPDRIGIMGFSAGGHLAVSASTHFDDGNPSAPDPLDRPSSRPDFAVLGYPVVSLTEPWTHQGSKTRPAGRQPRP